MQSITGLVPIPLLVRNTETELSFLAARVGMADARLAWASLTSVQVVS